ncbi:nitrile hydratase [Priestia megaterium]|nr:nitrile hydratase [Priestia megaterium]
MNGIHDVGGMDGLGKIIRVENEPIFHKEWERTAFGIMAGTVGQGLLNLDEFRHGIELMDPVDYLVSGYYAHWVATVEWNLVKKGVLDAQEVEKRAEVFLNSPNTPIPTRENPELVAHLQQLITTGGSTKRELSTPAKFQIGDKVKTKNLNPLGHTRLPRYARGRYGIVHALNGAHVFPDTHAHGKGEKPEYLYTIRFEAQELWGEKKSEMVNIDLWESYLESTSH